MHGCWRNVIPEEGLGVKAIAVCMIICFSNVVPEEGLGVKEIISVSQKRNLPKSL